jgi:hypothetical protein
MKMVEDIRRAIENIEGAVLDAPTELGKQGNVEGRVTLWDAMNSYPPLKVQDPYDDGDPQFGNVPQAAELIEFGPERDPREVKRAMDGGVGDEIRRSVLKGGVDALAFYVSFHQRGTQWGIYIYPTSLLYMAATVFDLLPVDFDTKLRLSFRALHQHELYHFAVDYVASQLEGILVDPVYRPARSRLQDATAGYILLEEELANAHMIRTMRGGHKSTRVKSRTSALRQFVAKQPAGYADGGNSTANAVFERRSSELVRKYIETPEGYEQQVLPAVDLFRLFPFDPNIDWRDCPIHILHDEHRLGIDPLALGLFRQVCAIQETSSFQRRFEGLPKQIRDKWAKTKEKIGQTTALPGLDFKPWRDEREGRVYSVRVDKGYRAHLRYAGQPPSWSAIEIGTHKELGHG